VTERTAGAVGRASTWLGVAALSCAAAAAPDPRDPRPRYLEVARRYASGERAAAVADVGRFSPAELDAEMDALRARLRAHGCADCSDSTDGIPLRAIALLHADRDELEERSSELMGGPAPPCGIRAHAELAERAATLLPTDPQSRDFARRFHLAMALRSLRRGCLVDAQSWAKAGLKKFSRDADLLFASGVVHEVAAASLQVRPLLGPAPPSREEATRALVQARLLDFEEARRAFEQVLAEDPARHEARLHLARIRLHQEHPQEARKVLEGLLARGPSPEVAYLAHLFLGRVQETQGLLLAAEEQYATAFALDPAQSAGVALSHVLQEKGESEEARAVLEGALREARRRTLPDPYWVYSFGPITVHTEMFERLREETRQ
jgi:tetratricopeptide (TPR) repeat protein